MMNFHMCISTETDSVTQTPKNKPPLRCGAELSSKQKLSRLNRHLLKPQIRACDPSLPGTLRCMENHQGSAHTPCGLASPEAT